MEKYFCVLELEIATIEPEGEAYIGELKVYCSDIERRGMADYKEACEKLAQLDFNTAGYGSHE